MKKLLLISIILFVAGLGLILYSDPIMTVASGTGGHVINQVTTFTNTNGNGGQISNGGGPTIIGNGTGPVSSKGIVGGSFATMEFLTIGGIASCGVGIILSAVETIKPSSSAQPRAVT